MHLIHGWYHPTHRPNGISIESAVFPEYTVVTDGRDGQTDRQTELDTYMYKVAVIIITNQRQNEIVFK